MHVTFAELLASSMADRLRVLQELWPLGILAKTLEEQAVYADAVTRSNAHDPDFSHEQLAQTALPNNTTGVANLAYLALNACVQDREAWRVQYDTTMQRLREQR